MMAEFVLFAASLPGSPPHADHMQHDTCVIPESPKEPADNSTNACTHSAARPGRITASQPPQNRPDIPFNKETVTRHDAAEGPCNFAQPEATQTPPLPAASNLEFLSTEHLNPPKQPLHSRSCTVPPFVEASKQTEYIGFQAAGTAYQPAEFDIVVDAHPAGKSTCSSTCDVLLDITRGMGLDQFTCQDDLKLEFPVPTAGTDEPTGAATTPGANAAGFDYLLSQSPSQAQFTPYGMSHSAVLLSFAGSPIPC